jgi:hypothetical protein
MSPLSILVVHVVNENSDDLHMRSMHNIVAHACPALHNITRLDFATSSALETVDERDERAGLISAATLLQDVC